MSDDNHRDDGAPGSAAARSAYGRRLVAVRGIDLLLLLIVALGSARLLAAVLGGAFFAARIEGESGGGDTVLFATLALLLVQTVLILGAIWLIILRRYALSWHDIGFRPAEPFWYKRAVLFGVLLVPVAGLVNAVVSMILGAPIENPQITTVAPTGFSWFALGSMVVMAGVVAPIGEEAAFRGLLFGWLRGRAGVWAAALLSGLAFAVLHSILVLVPALLVVGIALALVYHRSGSLWPVIVMHGLFNAIMIALLYFALKAGVAVP